MTSKSLVALKQVREKLEKVLPELSKEFGVTLKTGKGTYDPVNGSFTIKVEGIVDGGLSQEASRYNSLKLIMPELPDLESTFSYKGDSYKIVGANSRGSKILATNTTNGKTYLFSTDYIKLMFK